MPRHSVWTLYIALAIAFVQGWSDLAWSIGSGRLLYTRVVPPAKRTDYMALYYAWIGIIAGSGQLLAGRLLDLSAGLRGRILFVELEPYTVLFVAGVALSAVAGIWLRKVRADSPLTTGQFARMFLRGNPLMAIASLMRFHHAKDERATIAMTEHLGRTGSPLTVNELLGALDDPRFNVRFEAIVSIARQRPDARLTQALIKILGSDEPALGVISAWALGRMGDRSALEALRAGLGAPFRSVRAHCARSLGTLGDTQSIPVLAEGLANETDSGLQMAYAAALGQLQVESAAGRLLALLRSSQDGFARMELALALARIVGDEHHFVQLVRAWSSDPSAALVRVIVEVQADLDGASGVGDDLLSAISDCCEVFGNGDMAGGAVLLACAIRTLLTEDHNLSYAVVLQDCAARLDEFGAGRMEYVLLALHTLHSVARQPKHRHAVWPYAFE